MIEKRSIPERLSIAESLLVSVMQDLTEGQAETDTGTLQAAVNCQIEVNRIVWKLNEREDNGFHKGT